MSEEAKRKILSVPSLYPATTHALSSPEKGLQHTQLQPWNMTQEAAYILVHDGFKSSGGSMHEPIFLSSFLYFIIVFYIQN